MTKHESGLRKSVFSRTVIGRVPYAARPPYVMPRWLRRLLLALLALLLLLLFLVSCREVRKPESLAGSTLTGAGKVKDGGLAMERAQTVADTLVELGVEPSHVAAHGDGWGPCPGSGDEVDQRNRRVVLRIEC